MLDSTFQARPSASAPRGAWRDELKALLALGVPMGLTQLVQFSINTVDVLMIGRLGPEALAAAALGLVIFYVFFMLSLGPAMALSPLVSHTLGADPNNRDDVRLSVRMGLWIAALLLPFSLAMAFAAESIALALGQQPSLAARAAPYVMALAPGLPFMMGVIMLRNFLAAIERTRWPLVFIVATTALNAFLNWLLIYGNWGLPRLELVGAGIASSISHAAGFLMLAVYCVRDRRAAPFRLFANVLDPHWARFREILKLGAPIGVSIAFEALLFNACVFLMGLIGVNEVAAYQVALNVAATAFMMPLGLAMAGGVRVGLHKGAGDAAGVRRAALLTILASMAVMVLFWAPAMLSPPFVAGLYLDAEDAANGAVLALVASFLPIAAAFGLFDATQVAAMNGLRGLKDVRVPMILTGVSYWPIGFALAWFLGLHTDLGAVGVWWGLLAALFAAAASLSLRLYLLVR
ncbi:MAG: MATE family efflux transporter [Parvularculaceae bacterium]|nr:MATE family efflux transporter [Parvularculaceae bacterium]